MSNIFDEIANRGFSLLEAFKDFHQAIEDLKNDRGEAAPYSAEQEEAQKSIEPFSFSSMNGYHMGLEDGECDEDFPGRRFFRLQDLDTEDPAFWGGKEIGIPYAVAVRTHDGQNKLLPIKNGLFAEE